MSNEKIEEPILKPSLKRFTIFPIQYPDLWAFVKKHEAIFWTADEIKYDADRASWEKLEQGEKDFICQILAFFASADGIVMENLDNNFSSEVQIPEARAFYAVQTHIEQIHSETYSRLIEAFIKDPIEKDKLFNAIETIPCIKKKADWALKWMNPKKPFAERLIAFIIMEGVFFSGAFCAIFWLKNRGLMEKALGKSNEFIARDESLHALFGVELYKHLVGKVSEEKVHKIFKEAVEIEKEFITESLPCRLIGMNSEMMIEYIKYTADFWLSKLMYKKMYKSSNPFPFMVMISLDSKGNFFEETPSEYSKAASVSSLESRTFKQDVDF